MRDTMAAIGWILTMVLFALAVWFLTSYTTFRAKLVSTLDNTHASIFKTQLNDEIKYEMSPSPTPVYLLEPPLDRTAR